MYLQEENELHLKKNEKRKLDIKNYEEVIIHNDYLINGCKIFYMYDEMPLNDGICDMEDLAQLPDLENEFS